MALYKYHYIELDTKRSPRISLQNIVAGETGNVFWITFSNNNEIVDMSEKSDGEFIYRVSLRIRSNLGVRRQDSDDPDGGITFIEAQTGDHGKIHILLSADAYTSGKNRCVLEIYSKRIEEDDTLICSAEWTFSAEENPTGENKGLVYPMMAYYEQLAKSWATGGTGKREGEDTDNAAFYAQIARDLFDHQVVEPSVIAWLAANIDTFKDEISDDITAWLTAHITQPTTPVVDTSLSVSGAAADAKVTGEVKNIALTATNNVNTSECGNWRNNSSGAISSTTGTKYYGMAKKVAVTASSTYCISHNDLTYTGTMQMYVCYYTADGTFVSRESVNSYKRVTGAVVTIPATATQIHVYFYAANGITRGSAAGIQIELGSTPTKYHRPYEITCYEDIEHIDEIDAEIDGINQRMKTEASTPYRVDGLYYRHTLPEAYFAENADPQSYDDADQYLDGVIRSVSDGKHALFMTDIHYPSSAKNVNLVMQYIRSKLLVSKVLFGGDVLNRDANKYLAKQTLCEYLNDCVAAFGTDYLPTWGNHDLNTANSTALETERMDVGVSADLFVKHLDGVVHFEDYHNYGTMTGNTDDVLASIVDDAITEDATIPTTLGMTRDEIIAALVKYNRLHYYVDDPYNKIRYIVYNTGCPDNIVVRTILGCQDMPETYLQVLWLYDVLMSTPTGYDIIALAHEAIYKYDLNPDNLANSYYMRAILSQFSAMKLKVSATVWIDTQLSDRIPAAWMPNGNVTLDFSAAPSVGNIIVLCGHWHMDFMAKGAYTSSTYKVANYAATIINNNTTVDESNGEILIVCTRCDKNKLSDETPLTGVSENAIDIVTLADGLIELTRVGYSADNTAKRSFTIT